MTVHSTHSLVIVTNSHCHSEHSFLVSSPNKGVRKAEGKIARAVLGGQATAYSLGCNEPGRLTVYLAYCTPTSELYTTIAELQIVPTQQFDVSPTEESGWDYKLPDIGEFLVHASNYGACVKLFMRTIWRMRRQWIPGSPFHPGYEARKVLCSERYTMLYCANDFYLPHSMHVLLPQTPYSELAPQIPTPCRSLDIICSSASNLQALNNALSLFTRVVPQLSCIIMQMISAACRCIRISFDTNGNPYRRAIIITWHHNNLLLHATNTALYYL